MPGKIAKEIKKRLGDLTKVRGVEPDILVDSIAQTRIKLGVLIDCLPPDHPASLYLEELDTALADVVKRTTIS